MSSITNKKTGVSQVLVESGQGGRRLDNFLMAALRGVPRSRVYQMIRKGEVRVNGGRTRPEYRVQAGDRVRLPPVSTRTARPAGTPPEPLVTEIRNCLLYQDADMLVVNKPPGLVVHSGSGQTFGVIDVLRRALPDGAGLQLVHRLDRDTSGCLLISRTPAALRHLHDALRDGRVHKLYLALLQGDPGHEAVTVDRPLRKNVARGGERMVNVTPDGRHALSRFIPVRHFRDSTLCNVAIDTGRTHQIRVHAQFLGHPVAGDDKYGDRDFNRELRRHGLRRLFLHASRISVPRRNGGEITVEAPLPPGLSDFLSTWR